MARGAKRKPWESRKKDGTCRFCKCYVTPDNASTANGKCLWTECKKCSALKAYGYSWMKKDKLTIVKQINHLEKRTIMLRRILAETYDPTTLKAKGTNP